MFGFLKINLVDKYNEPDEPSNKNKGARYKITMATKKSKNLFKTFLIFFST